MESRRESREGESRGKNVGGYERLTLGLSGVALLRSGLRRRSLGGLFAAASGAMLAYRGLTGRCPVYQRLGIDTTREGLSHGIAVERAITVARPPQEVYRFWRHLENLPSFMRHLRSVSVIDDQRSRWVAQQGPMRLEWDAEIVEDQPGGGIAWRSLPGGDMDTAGIVTFAEAPGDRGTEVWVWMQLSPPGGRLAMTIAPFFRRLGRMQLGAELHRMKQILETGEIATSDMWREAQPPPEHARATRAGTPAQAGEAQAGAPAAHAGERREGRPGEPAPRPESEGEAPAVEPPQVTQTPEEVRP